MSSLTSFLARTHNPCSDETCTTCGGIGFFRRKLQKAFPSRRSIAVALKGLSGADARRLERKAICLAQTLKFLPETKRLEVLRHWLDSITYDPGISGLVLLGTNFGRHLAKAELELSLEAATPLLLSSKGLRSELRWVLAEALRVPGRLEAAIRDDVFQEKSQEQRRKDQAAAEKKKKQDERDAYFRALVAMPLKERLENAASERRFYSPSKPYGEEDWTATRDWGEWLREANKWRDALTDFRDEDIDSLSVEDTRALINLCEIRYFIRSARLLQRLYDRRHFLRHADMATIRRAYGALKSQEMLTELVLHSSVPIEHYPVELAEEVTEEWLQSLPKAARRVFLGKLFSCRLRVWTKARKRLPSLIIDGRTMKAKGSE